MVDVGIIQNCFLFMYHCQYGAYITALKIRFCSLQNPYFIQAAVKKKQKKQTNPKTSIHFTVVKLDYNLNHILSGQTTFKMKNRKKK